MNEDYTESEQPAGGDKKIQSGQRWVVFRKYFQRLKEKYTKPGDDRPDLRYNLAVTFWIVLISWWVFSFILLISRSNGRFQEGKFSFVLMLIERTGCITFGMAALVWLKKDPSKENNWKWWTAAICLAAGIFLALCNPIRDIPYLSHPAEVVFQDWEKEYDGSYRYSNFFEIWGENENGQKMSFHINRSTYSGLPTSDQATALTIEYLPHTEMVLSISAQ